MNYVAWDVLEKYLTTGISAQIPLAVNTNLCFLIPPTTNTLSLRIPLETALTLPLSPFREIEIAEKAVGSKRVVELTVYEKDLHKTFYHFCIELSDLIINHNISPSTAISNCLANWSTLLASRSILDGNKQLGLAGELCFLYSLIKTHGPTALNAWVGPTDEPHDFRLERFEVEVKSTSRNERIHRINGFQQLIPSTGMELYILSLQFESAGSAASGKTLPNRIHDIRELLSHNESFSSLFNSNIAGLGYLDTDARFYTQRFKLRSIPTLIPVDEAFPKLTEASINTLFAPRIVHVEYDINVDGLGFAEGSSGFYSKLGPLTLSEFAGG